LSFSGAWRKKEKMDLATLLGMILAFGVVIGGIMVGSSITIFIDIPSVLIVMGGSTFVLMSAYRFKDLINTVRVLKNAFFFTSSGLIEISRQLVEMAVQARKEGLLALEQMTEKISDPFFQKGIQLVVDGHEAEEVEAILGARSSPSPSPLYSIQRVSFVDAVVKVNLT